MSDNHLEADNGQAIPEDLPDDRFLRNITNQNFTWTFQLIGRRKVIGRVITFIWDANGIPITLMIQPELGSPVEIPWSSIQTIQQGKGNH